MNEAIVSRRDFERLERKIDLLLREKEVSQHWVSVFVLGEATGWNPKEIRRYREAGLVKFRRKNGKVEYNLESIPNELKKTA